MNDYLIPLFRFAIVYPLLYLVTMIMGKRSIAELPVIDFIVVITIGAVVGADIADPAVPHGPTILMVVVIGLIQYALTITKRKNAAVRNLTTVTPTVVIENGRFLVHNMSHVRLTVNDILPMLREKDIFNLSQVQWAILEPNGNLSVQMTPEARPLTLKDMGRTAPQESFPVLLVADGKIVPNALKQAGKTRAWLDQQLNHQGYSALDEVYLAALETDGTFYASPMRQSQAGASIHY